VSRRNLGAEYGKALDAFDHAERKMLRAVRAWEKARARLRSLGKRLDQHQAELDALDPA
jgi:hypothetical protein